jgi:small-conductance mechanosensitive channel
LIKMRSFSQWDLTFQIFCYVNNFDLFSNQQEKVKLKIMTFEADIGSWIKLGEIKKELCNES